MSSSTVLGVVKKVISILFAVWILVSLIFVTFYVSHGDPAAWMVPKSGVPEFAERVVDEARLDESLLVQYVDYLVDTFTGDFRMSTGAYKGVDIQDFIWGRAGNTVALLSMGIVGSLALGAALEFAVGRRRSGPQAALAHGFSLLLMSFPVFSLAILMLVINVELDLGFPLYGDGTYSPYGGEIQVWSVIEHSLLPVAAVVLASAGFASLLIREGVSKIRVPGAPKDGRLALFASGLATSRPAVHFYVAWTMAAAMMVDVVFSYGGLGQTAWEATVSLDFPLLMAVVFLVSVIVMAAASLTSLCLRLLGGVRIGDILADWTRREPTEDAGDSAPEHAVAVPRTWAGSAWRWFGSSLAGMSALILLGVIIVIGALAPLIAPAPEPSNLEYLEPSHYPDWMNPLPPSLEPSPYSGMTHLLGTDPVGRDVFSIWLFGARDAGVTAAALVFGTITLGLVIAALAAATLHLSEPVSKGADFLLTAGARAIVAIPLPLFVTARLALERDLSFAPLVIMLAFYAWAWILIARPVRAELRAAGGRGKASLTPLALAESLSVAKFAVPLIILTDFPLYVFGGLGSASDMTWGELLDIAYSFSAFTRGDWHLIIPPLLGVIVVCAASFVLLDRAEHAVRASAPARRRLGSG